MSKINTQIQIGSWLLPNRVVFQPMEGCDGTEAGAVGELTRRRYLRFAGSGAAVIWFEAVSVRTEGRANPRQLYLCGDTADSFRALLEEMREKALAETGIVPKIIAQLTHSGRFAKPNGTPEPLVAYRNPHWERGRENQPYVIVSDNYCAKVVDSYAKAAKLASQAGFDGIDVKCCHGYLLNEFLSAYERPGSYGGCFGNRARLFFDCLEAARQSIPADVLLTTRLNACDGFPYPYGYGVAGMPPLADRASASMEGKVKSPRLNESEKSILNEIDLSECKEILRVLRERFAMPLVNITLGNPYLIPHVNRPARNLPEEPEVGMERIRAVMKELQGAFPALPLAASGLSYPGAEAVDYADSLLEEGAAALAGFGRLTFAYPGFYRDYRANGSLDRRKTCLACGKCTELMRAGSVTGCPVRDAEVYLPLYRKYVVNREV